MPDIHDQGKITICGSSARVIMGFRWATMASRVEILTSVWATMSVNINARIVRELIIVSASMVMKCKVENVLKWTFVLKQSVLTNVQV